MRSDEKNEDLVRRNGELEQRISNMERQRMSLDATNEVQRVEIERLRDALNRERAQHTRDKKGLNRQHENMIENVKLDHSREMDKQHQIHQAEVDRQNGV